MASENTAQSPVRIDPTSPVIELVTVPGTQANYRIHADVFSESEEGTGSDADDQDAESKEDASDHDEGFDSCSNVDSFDTDSDDEEDPWVLPSDIKPPPTELHKLTIRLELEFVLIKPSSQQEFDEDPSFVNAVHQALEDVTFHTDLKSGYRTSELPMNLSPDYAACDDAQHWVVEMDSSVPITANPIIEVLRQKSWPKYMRVTSRKLNYHGVTDIPDYAPEITVAYTWTDELKGVNNALIELGKKENHRVLDAPATGFNVHIGNDDHGISVEVARKLMYIFTAFERQFDSITSTKRIGGGFPGYQELPGPRNYDYDSLPYHDPWGHEYNPIEEFDGLCVNPASKLHFLNLEKYRKENPDADHQNDPKARRDVKAWLSLIKECQSAVKLRSLAGGLFNGFGDCVLDCSHIWDAEWIAADAPRRLRKDVKRKCLPVPTIRFKSHPGTLNIHEQTNWVTFVATLVEFCYRTTEDEVYDWCLANWANYDFSFLDILSKISAPVAVSQFYREVLHIEPSPFELETRELRYEECCRDDKVARGGQPARAIERNFRGRDRECVKQKIRHKMHLGFYGLYPEEFVARFFDYYREGDDHERGDSASLILPSHLE